LIFFSNNCHVTWNRTGCLLTFSKTALVSKILDGFYIDFDDWISL